GGPAPPRWRHRPDRRPRSARRTTTAPRWLISTKVVSHGGWRWRRSHRHRLYSPRLTEAVPLTCTTTDPVGVRSPDPITMAPTARAWKRDWLECAKLANVWLASGASVVRRANWFGSGLVRSLGQPMFCSGTMGGSAPIFLAPSAGSGRVTVCGASHSSICGIGTFSELLQTAYWMLRSVISPTDLARATDGSLDRSMVATSAASTVA